MIDTLSNLLGLDLSVYDSNLLLLISAVFLLLIISFVYDLMLMLFGYIGGKRK